MEIIKPKRPKKAYDTYGLESTNDFYKYSHGLYENEEYTICGNACEEWGYVNYKKAKKITCPQCLNFINFCKSYKD